MKRAVVLGLIGLVPVWAGELPEKAAGYHEALMKRPESAALFQRFRDAWLEERPAEALEAELLARAELGTPGDWAVLARARSVMGNEAGALVAYQKARGDTPVAWIDLEIARLQLAARDFAAAEKSALAVPENDKLRAEAMKLAGLACLRGERVDQALECWRKAVESAPADKGLLEDLTELTRREGRMDLALEYCGKWRDSLDDPYGRALATLRRSELLLAASRFDEAAEEIRTVMRVSGDGSWIEREAINRAEQAFIRQRGSMEWAKWIAARADENPARLGFRRAHARALAASGKTDDALQVFAEVLKRSPGDMSARWERLDLLERAGKLEDAFKECGELVAAENSETARLRRAELAFRLDKLDEVKRVLDEVIAAADPARRVSLAGIYAGYGLHDQAERIWREAAAGESGGSALRELAKSLRSRKRADEAAEVWKELGRSEVAADRIEAARMLAAEGRREDARRILTNSAGVSGENPDVASALAEIELLERRSAEALAIYQKLARAAKRPEELDTACHGWLSAAKSVDGPLRDLREETADRCLRAAFLAETGAALPPVREGDELERSFRLSLLRKHGRWAEVVALMETAPGERSLLFLSDLAAAKFSAGDLPGALQAARTWRERAVDQPGPWLREAEVLEKLGKQDEAVRLLRRASARFEDNEEIASSLFDLLESGADGGDALDLAWFRHDRAPDERVRGEWRRRILAVSEGKNRMEDLRLRLEERAKRDPASPWPWIALAELAAKLGDSREQLACLRRAVVNSPQDVTLLSSVAGLEERMGNSPEALRLYSEIARLKPGPDAVRLLARIKIRLGDADGGLRDVRRLMAEKRIGSRELEEIVGELASWGRMDDTIRLLSFLEPSVCDARMSFVLGSLMEIDGREDEAISAYAKVLAEPDDPAEQSAAFGYHGEVMRSLNPALLLINGGYGGSRMSPGSFRGLEVPGSLQDAKLAVQSRLFRIGMARGGEIWEKVVGLVPEFGKATLEQWREVKSYVHGRSRTAEADWLAFLNSHPGNPLGIELLVQSGNVGRIGAEELRVLLHREPPLTVIQQLKLRSNGRVDWKDNLKFLNSIPVAEWKMPEVASLGLRMLLDVYSNWGPVIDEAGAVNPCLTMLSEANLQEPEAGHVADLIAASALMNGDEEAFLKRFNTFRPQTTAKIPEAGSPLLRQVFRNWSAKADAEKRDRLIARIQSPLERCVVSYHLERDAKLALVERELAALPEDAPAEVKRGLWQIKIPLLKGTGAKIVLEKLAADESDPVLAYSAFAALSEIDPQLARKPDTQAKMERLLVRVRQTSPAYGLGSAYGYGLRGMRASAGRPPAHRWGAQAMLNGGSAYDGLRIQRILDIEDKMVAGREGAKFLLRLAATSDGDGALRSQLEALRRVELLETIMDAVNCPDDAGLCRKVAVMRLMRATGRSDRETAILSDLSRTRPWEPNWTIDLALRTADDGQRNLLLDRVVDCADFGDLLLRGLNSMPAGPEGSRISLLDDLAEWARVSGKSHPWVGDVLIMIARGESGTKRLEPGAAAWLSCYRRYLDLVLNDRDLAEFGFRVCHAMRHVETPEKPADAARRALLSGAYSSAASKAQLKRLRGVSGNLKLELAALEHLVIIAGEQGDESAFPPDFLGKLEAADRETHAWVEKLLAARKVEDLPDVSNVAAMKSGDWTVVARHEAAMLRAEKLAGRDEWLVGVFRNKNDANLSGNLSHVIRASLLEAAFSQGAGKRALRWLEAAAGPSSGWDDSKRIALSEASNRIMLALPRTDLAAMLQVLDTFREHKVCIANPEPLFSNLGQLVLMESRKPGAPDIAGLLGRDTEALCRLGYWRYSGRRLCWNWALPSTMGAIATAIEARDSDALEKKKDPSFVELMMLRYSTHGVTTERKALIKVAPVLAKLPKVYRDAVVTSLTAEMTPADLKGLPDFLTAIMDEETDRKSAERMEKARGEFKTMRERGGVLNDDYVARLLAPVLLDDPEFVNEVIAAWKPEAEKDKSGGRMATFAYSLLNSGQKDVRLLMAAVRTIESINGGELPPAKPGRSDLMESLVSNLGSATSNVNLWREVAAMSPSFQVRFWSVYVKRSGSSYSLEPEDARMFREAVPEDGLTRKVLEWFLQVRASQRDSRSKIESVKIVEMIRAFKQAGMTPEELALVVTGVCDDARRVDHPSAVLLEIPILLDEIKTVSPDASTGLLRAIHAEWYRLLSEERARVPLGEASLPVPPDREKWVAMMKFVVGRGGQQAAKNDYFARELGSLVVALGDDELLEGWLKSCGKSLVANADIIFKLLEMDRIAEAVALTPAPGNWINNSRPFTADLEKLVAKLRTDPSPAAFRLSVLLSLAFDATKEKAPAEKRQDRVARLTDEYRRKRSELSQDDRIALCMALPFGSASIRGRVPELDEFSIDEASVAYRKMQNGDANTNLGRLFIPMICSRMHAGDMSGLASYTEMIPKPQPGLPNPRSANPDGVTLSACLCSLANSRGGVPDAAVSNGFLAMAKTLSKPGYDQSTRERASFIVMIATKDAAARRESLKELGLEEVKPSASDPEHGLHMERSFREELMKLAVLREDLQEELLAIIDRSSMGVSSSMELFALMGDSAMRGRIAPDFFLKITRDSLRVPPGTFENLEAYFNERRADFSEEQRAEMEGLLERWRDPAKPVDPKLLEEIKARNQQRMRQRMEEINKRRMESMRPMNDR